MTIADLIRVLQRMDPNWKVEIAGEGAKPPYWNPGYYVSLDTVYLYGKTPS